MIRLNFTYNLRQFLLVWLGYEIAFGILFSLFLWLIGFFKSELNSNNGFLFENPSSFLLLLLIPLFFFFQYRSMRKRNKMVNKMANHRIQSLLFSPINDRKLIIRFLFLRNVIFFLALAFANPIFGKYKQNALSQDMELIVCLDVSNSMNTRDIEGISRLEASKRAIGQLINKLTGERVGICVFAGTAFVQLPLTMDYHAAKLFVQEIETDMVSAQGTNVSQALTIANQMFTKLESSKGILMVTDGEDHVGINDSIINELKEKKVEISILGIGTEEGGPVPVDVKKPGLGFKKMPDGKRVISKLNSNLIRSLAESLNGNASVTTQAFPNMNEVLTEINQMKQGKSRNLEIEINESWYQYPLFLEILFFLTYLFIPFFKNE